MSLWISALERTYRQKLRKLKLAKRDRLIALLLCDHDPECAESLEHLQNCGFDHVVVLSAEAPGNLRAGDLWICDTPVSQEAQHAALNAAFYVFRGHWLHYAYNHERLYVPRFEKRPLRALVQFAQTSERFVVQGAVVDCFDHEGRLFADQATYHGEPRMLLFNPESKLPKVKQFYGGLRSRFAAQVRQQRIDRPALIKLRRRLRIFPSGEFSDVHVQSFANARGPAPVATILSERVARGLLHNQTVENSNALMGERTMELTRSTETFVSWGVMSTGGWV